MSAVMPRRVSLLGPDDPPPPPRKRRKCGASRARAERGARLVLLAIRLAHGAEVTSSYIHETYRVSKATAKRDMALLARVVLGDWAGGERGTPRVLRMASDSPGASR